MKKKLHSYTGHNKANQIKITITHESDSVGHDSWHHFSSTQNKRQEQKGNKKSYSYIELPVDAFLSKSEFVTLKS